MIWPKRHKFVQLSRLESEEPGETEWKKGKNMEEEMVEPMDTNEHAPPAKFMALGDEKDIVVTTGCLA